MNSELSLARLVLSAGVAHHERVAIRTVRREISHAQLGAIVTSYALHMKSNGIDRSSCVAIDTDHPVMAISLTLACALLGCSWVRAMRPAMSNDEVRITHMLSDGVKPHRAKPNVIKVDRSWLSPPDNRVERNDLLFDGYSTPNDTWMIGQSSGTTGTPKYMAISEANAFRMQRALFDLNDEMPKVLSLFHPLSLITLKWAFNVLSKGGSVMFGNDVGFLMNSSASFVIGSPKHLADALMNLPPPQHHRMKLAGVSGGPFAQPLVDKVLQHFSALVNIYGATEAGAICTKTFMHGSDYISGSVGWSMPNARVQIVGDNDVELPASTEGMVRTQTDCLASAYIGDHENTAKVFRNGWFYPGDVGYLSDAGELFVTGRADDRLNIGGSKINAAVVDLIIQGIPDVKDGVCFAAPAASGINELAAIISVRDGADAESVIRLINAAILRQLPRENVPRRFFVSNRIPRNPNGKVTRHLAIDATQGMAQIKIRWLNTSE